MSIALKVLGVQEDNGWYAIAIDMNLRGFGKNSELLSKVVFELKIKRQSGFQESPRFHQRIVHLQSPLPGNQSHVTFSNSFLHIVPA